MTINSISSKIFELAEKLEKGELHADEIIEMTDLSRQLHERMIVLQYKTFENMPPESDREEENQQNEKTATQTTSESVIENTVMEDRSDTHNVKHERHEIHFADNKEVSANEPDKTHVYEETQNTAEEVSEERTAFRIDNSITPSNQISLIDSIEEIKKMEKSLNDVFSNSNPSLAQKLHQKPIANLKTAITINQKFKFISTLFQNDTAAFETAVDRINSCVTYLEADEYIRNGPGDRYEWEMKSPTAREMMDLVERRFL